MPNGRVGGQIATDEANYVALGDRNGPDITLSQRNVLRKENPISEDRSNFRRFLLQFGYVQCNPIGLYPHYLDVPTPRSPRKELSEIGSLSIATACEQMGTAAHLEVAVQHIRIR
jgi:hypothetical protein